MSPFCFSLYNSVGGIGGDCPTVVVGLSVAVVCRTFSWLFSCLERYSLHWYLTFAACLGVVISHTCARAEAAWNSRLAIWTTDIVTVAFCCSLIHPIPIEGCRRFYRSYYAARQAVIETLAFNQQRSTRVLALRTQPLAFYVRKAKMISVGDYFGPARYDDLFKAVKGGNCLPYLNRLDISAVIANPSTSADWRRCSTRSFGRN
jgi:hypothetical protein